MLDDKMVIAMAVAAIAEETGEDIRKLRVVSFKKIEKNRLVKYLEENNISYRKYQMGDDQNG